LGLLRQINEIEGFEHFCLVGGTNLALRYGHRISVDLDFFSKEKFESNQVVSIISRHFRHFELVFQKNQTLIFDIDQNLKAMQPGSDMASLPYAAEQISKFLLDAGLAKSAPDLSKLFDDRFIKQYAESAGKT